MAFFAGMPAAIKSECWPFSQRNGGLFPAGMVAEFIRNTQVDKAHEEAVRNILVMQRDDEIIKLVDDLKAYPQIRWKDSIKEVLAKAI